MIITKVKIKKLNNPESKIKALAAVTFDDSLVVTDMRVCESQNGLFVAMPNKLIGQKYKDIAFPCTAEFRDVITQTVLAEYEKCI